MNKKLCYVTTVNLDDSSAQSLQIQSMSKAFTHVKKNDFKLYAFSSGSLNNEVNCSKKLFYSNRPKWLRTLHIFFGVIFDEIENYSIFTRDLYLAFFFVMINKEVVWESHQQTSQFAKKTLRFLDLFSSFKVLTISEALKESGEICIHSDKIYSYHDGCEFDLNQQNDLISFDNKTALYTGALHKGKDVESLKPLICEFPEWDFLFIGGNDADIERYQNIFIEYDNVKFVGRIPHGEIVKYQVSADVLLFPLTTSNKLWRYTSPLKLFEYMKAGKPIIASNIGSVSEVIDNSNAFVFDGENGVVNAFNSFINSPDSVIIKKVQKNIELVRGKYSWDKRAEFILNNIYIR